MAEEQQDSQESVKNPEETTTPENDESQTVEASKESSSEGRDDGKEKGESFYEEQLKQLQEEKERLEAEAKERERQIEIKDRAIEAQKKRLKETGKTFPDAESIKAAVLRDVKVDMAVEKAAKSEAEAKLIRHHLEHSIVRTGDAETDVRNALAIANAARIQELLNREASEDASAEASIASMSGGNVRGPQPSGPKSAARKEAEKLLPKDLHPFLDKYIPR